MKIFLTLIRREWSAFFYAPVAYAVMIFFLILMGLSFSMLVHVLAEGPASGGVVRLLLGESLFFWIAMLMVAPVLTMRLFAEEKRTGTLETLMTAPVGDATVVLAKYTAVLIVFGILWLPTLLYPVLLAQVSPHHAPMDYAALGTAYVGIGCIGAFFLSIGLLSSSLTRNQAVSAVMTMVLLCLFFFWGFIPYYARSGTMQEWGRYTSAVLHMMEFSRGVLDTRPLLFYGSGTAFMLFLTVKVVEARKWNS
jgi:ABC-2 type transport system permease protein